MTDFTELQVGTKVFSPQNGEGVINELVTGDNRPVRVSLGVVGYRAYTRHGHAFFNDKHPSIFLTKQDAIDYLTNLKEPLPEDEQC